MSIKITTENFEEEVLNSDIPVLVDFHAVWCGPCKIVSPTVERVAKKFEGKIKVGKVDVDKNESLAIKYQILSVPTFVFFRDGKVIHKESAALSEEVIINKIHEYM